MKCWKICEMPERVLMQIELLQKNIKESWWKRICIKNWEKKPGRPSGKKKSRKL